VAVAISRWSSRPPAGPPPRDSTQLVVAHLAGDGDAFAELVRRYRDRLLNFIDRMIRDRERAEDLVQEAFLRVFRHIGRYDHSRKFSTWIYTIASNLAKNELRNRGRNPIVLYQALRPKGEEDTRPLQFEDARTRPDDLFAGRHLRELVDATVATLAPHHREVFVLRELEGRSYEEIAGMVGVNLGTVKSRLNRARHAFAERIAPYLD
jgi:RNA polymerase sigma-70 factor (ECF subfamily)